MYSLGVLQRQGFEVVLKINKQDYIMRYQHDIYINTFFHNCSITLVWVVIPCTSVGRH